MEELQTGTAATATLSAKEVRGPAPLVQLVSEPAPKLIVDPPLAEQLAYGLLIVQYRTENLRIVPVFGAPALQISPRIGHLHITLDNAVWHWVDASNEPIVIKGLPPGFHQLLIELADPRHKVLDQALVDFIIPG